MAKYRYWMLDDDEDPENDPTLEAADSQEAAEEAASAIDGDGDPIGSNKIELAVRMLPDGPVEMFEIFVDWSPTFTAYSRGILPKP